MARPWSPIARSFPLDSTMMSALMRFEMVVMVWTVVRVEQSRPCVVYSVPTDWGDNGHPTVEWVRQLASNASLESVVLDPVESDGQIRHQQS